MSDGEICRHCGYQEAEHEIGDPLSHQIRDGYKCSLDECTGFESEPEYLDIPMFLRRQAE